MSIIYDALKKADKSPSANETPAASPIKNPGVKINFSKLIIPILFIGALIFLATNMLGQKNSTKKSNVRQNIKSQQKTSRHTSSTSGQNASTSSSRGMFSSAETFKLDGIIYEEDSAIAIIDGQMLKTGESINGYIVAGITPNKATLINNKNEVKDLTL